MIIDYPNAHATNPHYRPEPRSATGFSNAILNSYAALNARRAAEYEAELVRLSPPLDKPSPVGEVN